MRSLVRARNNPATFQRSAFYDPSNVSSFVAENRGSTDSHPRSESRPQFAVNRYFARVTSVRREESTNLLHANWIADLECEINLAGSVRHTIGEGNTAMLFGSHESWTRCYSACDAYSDIYCVEIVNATFPEINAFDLCPFQRYKRANRIFI